MNEDDMQMTSDAPGSRQLHRMIPRRTYMLLSALEFILLILVITLISPQQSVTFRYLLVILVTSLVCVLYMSVRYPRFGGSRIAVLTRLAVYGWFTLVTLILSLNKLLNAQLFALLICTFLLSRLYVGYRFRFENLKIDR